ncbi:hypothetical protein MG290_13295 [Flavobacterium sp. CBA20B-1]|uniref:hypothetical protein n=1 Tax=unclassified Flavobacterium TaxID=196869 RepID=UPI0022255B41|nr:MULTISPECIES: hypothetical protein [unclassified Flavobacterium]WCM41899.1 hypothetical protein MG290_13295 [Flavobacterium sp. CBA20B-1]
MRLLIVEDEATQIQLYIDVIESFNKQNGTEIIPIPLNSLDEAKKALLSSEYDAAIVDLRLSSNTVDLEGLELIDEIIDKLRFPLFIVSGSIAQIDKEENFLFKKRSRDGNFQDVLSEIIEVYNTGITHILGRKGKIDEYLNKIFWDHLSASMDIWINDQSRTPEQKQKILERYILLHIQEYLELTTESDFEDYHPAEIYITPPIKTKLFTGDILLENDSQKRYIVLTPSCDLAHEGKTENVLLVEVEDKRNGQISELKAIINNNELGKDKRNNASGKLKNLIKNNIPKYHFLPEYKDLSAGLIDFQLLKSVNKNDITNRFTRLTSVNNSFTKDIVSRFSFYYSRQGSPDFNVDEIYDTLLK